MPAIEKCADFGLAPFVLIRVNGENEESCQMHSDSSEISGRFQRNRPTILRWGWLAEPSVESIDFDLRVEQKHSVNAIRKSYGIPWHFIPNRD